MYHLFEKCSYLFQKDTIYVLENLATAIASDHEAMCNLTTTNQVLMDEVAKANDNHHIIKITLN